MADFPSGSEDDNLSDSDYDPECDKKATVLSDSSSASDMEDSSDDDVPLAHLLPAVRNRLGKPKPKWTKVEQNDDPSHVPHFAPYSQNEEPEIARPIHYFQNYFSNDLLDHIVDQSNLYSVQNDPNKPLQLTREELEIFIGTIVYMSIFGLPRHRLYWTSSCRVSKVADMLSRNRWEDIKKTCISMIIQIFPRTETILIEINYSKSDL